MNESSWKFFFILTLSCIVVQAFFAMVEMACVSFNKVRLQYYVSSGNRRAKWLSFLLNHPPQLFGTILIGINAALLLGSEASRRFYDSLGLSPDWAPLTQVVFVIILAEIAPMIAGRRYAEHAAMIGVPVLYFCSILFRPIIWMFHILCQISNRLIGSPPPGEQYLSREELQKILEEREEVLFSKPEKVEFNTIVANIFSLKNKTAKELMQSLSSIQMIPAFCSVGELRALLSAHYTPYIPVYHQRSENIVAIAYPRDLLRLNENKRVREYARSPWFITENTSILQILKQFRRNNQSIAVVLNEAGLAVGILTLDEIIDEIFGRSDQWMAFGDIVPEMHHVFVDRTFSGDMKIKEFNEKFHVNIEAQEDETFEELMTRLLGHRPSKGEELRIDQFELTVEEAPLIGTLTIAIRTIY